MEVKKDLFLYKFDQTLEILGLTEPVAQAGGAAGQPDDQMTNRCLNSKGETMELNPLDPLPAALLPVGDLLWLGRHCHSLRDGSPSVTELTATTVIPPEPTRSATPPPATVAGEFATDGELDQGWYWLNDGDQATTCWKLSSIK
ncbi:hypothetical protein D4S03_04820 [bacterium]|nr:MAG: hypothetical protein D4S03_04820 [bacterium]